MTLEELKDIVATGTGIPTEIDYFDSPPKAPYIVIVDGGESADIFADDNAVGKSLVVNLEVYTSKKIKKSVLARVRTTLDGVGVGYEQGATSYTETERLMLIPFEIFL